ncbi:hypothetical protein D3C85_284720 [compost metagenome]
MRFMERLPLFLSLSKSATAGLLDMTCWLRETSWPNLTIIGPLAGKYQPQGVRVVDISTPKDGPRQQGVPTGLIQAVLVVWMHSSQAYQSQPDLLPKYHSVASFLGA